MAAREGPRRQVPFGGHQIAEYAVAAALVAVGIHLNGRPAAVLVVGGVVLGAFALVSKGPLSAARLVPKRLHLNLDLVIALAFALSPLLYLHNLQLIPLILSEAVALLLVRMSLTTEIVPHPRPDGGSTGSAAARLGALFAPRPSKPTAGQQQAARSVEAVDAQPAATAPVAPADPAGAVAATAGRLVGTAVAKARDSDVSSVAARSLGRATGHARRVGRAARAATTAKEAPASGPVPPTTSTPPD
jgi:hypothetical protein